MHKRRNLVGYDARTARGDPIRSHRRTNTPGPGNPRRSLQRKRPYERTRLRPFIGPSWRPGPHIYENYEVSTNPLEFAINPPQSTYVVTVRMNGNLVYWGRSVESTEPEVF